jgi:predicted nucleic acid-binding protein
MWRALLDSNALDPLLADTDGYSSIIDARAAGVVELLMTHVTLDEVNAIPDADGRGRLVLMFVSVARLVPSSSFVVGVSRLDQTRLSEDSSGLDPMMLGNSHHSRDAVIGETARSLGCALVTGDRRLTHRAARLGVEVLDLQSLIQACRERSTSST